MTNIEAIDLLVGLIKIPSTSSKEDASASYLVNYLQGRGYKVRRVVNNILLFNRHFDPAKKTVVLCAHHDTVPPNDGYTLDPYSPTVTDGRLYGLGSNDDGASLVALTATFEHFYNCDNLKYNLALLLTAEEEISGRNGIAMMQERIDNVELLVVGEPTKMDIAIAERGLMVVDCETIGVAGHAANYNTVNPILGAMDDIGWFRTYKFDRESEVLGEVKMSVTVIAAGERHNIVPSTCNFTVDIRNNGCYTNQEILETIKANVKSNAVARSTRLRPSQVTTDHPFVRCCMEQGAKPFGSNTLSDQSLVDWCSVKIGVGDTNRSHTADEYILVDEIESGIDRYIKIFNSYIL